MRLQQTKLEQSKAIVHIAQALIIFIAGCLAVVILTKDGRTDGRIGWYFGLCFLSIPAIIYQIMVPMWSRAWRLQNTYAYAAVDVLFTILWFSAFITVASWVSAGKTQGGKDQKKAASCEVFAFGTASKCTTGEAAIAFGVFIFLLFLATSAISVRQAIRYKQSGILPGSQTGGAYTATGIDAQNKDAWSANTDDLASDPYHHDAEDSTTNIVRDEHALLSSASPSGQQNPFHDGAEGGGEANQYSIRAESWENEAHPGRPLSWGTDRGSGSFVRVDTECKGGNSGAGAVHMPDEEEHRIQSALSPGGFEDEGLERRPVQFPAGNY